VGAVRLRGGLHDEGLRLERRRGETEREGAFAELLVARGRADGELAELVRAGKAERALLDVERGQERIDDELEARGGIVLRDADALALCLRHGSGAADGEKEIRQIAFDGDGELIA